MLLMAENQDERVIPDRGGDHLSMVKLNVAYEKAVEYAAWRG